MLIRHRREFDRHHPPEPAERRHQERRASVRTALVYPIIKQADFAVDTLSRKGLSGRCAIALKPEQSVHVSLDTRSFQAADIRWVIDRKCGLLLEEPLILPDVPELRAIRPGLEYGDSRFKIALAARLATTEEMIAATVRGHSGTGLQIESDGHIGEGELVLVRTKGQPARRARVQWSHDSIARLAFDHVESPFESILENSNCLNPQGK